MVAGRVDVHTHGIAPELPAPSRSEGYAWPTVAPIDEHRALISVGDRRYREVDDRCWSADRRVADMDAEGVAVQVVSPTPVTLCHDATTTMVSMNTASQRRSDS